MQARVFISHASQNKAAAIEICDGLERLGICCWMAPRDIAPGVVFAEAVVHAIDACSQMVLVLSQDAITSSAVISEVSVASDRHKRIIPVRIQNIRPTGALEFYVSTAHWLDAFEGPLGPSIQRLAELVRPLPVSPPGVARSEPAIEARRDGKSDRILEARDKSIRVEITSKDAPERRSGRAKSGVMTVVDCTPFVLYLRDQFAAVHQFPLERVTITEEHRHIRSNIALRVED